MYWVVKNLVTFKQIKHFCILQNSEILLMSDYQITVRLSITIIMQFHSYPYMPMPQGCFISHTWNSLQSGQFNQYERLTRWRLVFRTGLAFLPFISIAYSQTKSNYLALVYLNFLRRSSWQDFFPCHNQPVTSLFCGSSAFLVLNTLGPCWFIFLLFVVAFS